MKKRFVFAIFLVFLFSTPCQATEMLTLDNGCINVFIVTDLQQKKLPINISDFYEKLSLRLQSNSFEINNQLSDKEFLRKPFVIIFLYSAKLTAGNYDEICVTWHLAENLVPENSTDISYQSPGDLLEKIATEVYKWDFISRQLKNCQ